MIPGKPVALVIGASSGIGRACAIHLAQLGYQVYAASRSACDFSISSGIYSLCIDVTDQQSVASGCDLILEREARLDVLVNSAGVGLAGPIELTSPEEALAQFDVNCFGVLRACRTVLPIMREQGDGIIINISSIAGLLAVPYQGIYSASKFALEGLTEALRMEVKAFGIRVVLVEPGDHRTGFTTNRVWTKESADSSRYQPRSQMAVERMEQDERLGPSPERVARLVGRIVQACDPRLRYSTGPLSQRAAIWLKRLGPHRLVEKMIAAYYRI